MVNATPGRPTLLFTAPQVEALLDLDQVRRAVEAGFARLAGDQPPPPSGVLGLPVAGGGFHLKAAVFPAGRESRPYLAAKLNANFPANPVTRGLPTIQGLLLLADATTGEPLAVMDSTALTARRTAAATAVAVQHLTPDRPLRVALAGCGAQAEAQLDAVRRVRAPLALQLSDADPARAEALASRLAGRIGCAVSVATDFRAAARASDLVITCTSATTPILGPEDVAEGTLVAAVGADNEHKSEIAPALMARAAVVTDSTPQCAQIGDLHHALAAGAMRSDQVCAELGQVVARKTPPPRGDRPIVFDSTGLPFQDVVTAALVYEGAGRVGEAVVFGRAGSGGRP